MLKEEGIEVVLVNSNPATIMTDKDIADRVYIEPLTIKTIKKIILKEKPDSIIPTLGGQTGLNMAVELEEEGFLKEHNIKLLGTSPEGIKKAEDRQGFKDTMEKIGEPCIPSKVVTTVEDAVAFTKIIGYPVIIRPAYTLGGSGGGIANNIKELEEFANSGIRASRVGQILVEKCISGWKEIEYEVIRDSKGNSIVVCNMENVDPVGVHTGDSIVVAPTQTLSSKECKMLRKASLKIIDELKIEGGCNVQFALEPNSFEYAVIEVNPRVSRSSALASKATGYPIAKVATKIAIGYTLEEIPNAVTGKTLACFEPTIDYLVVKFPKWPFDKFITANKTLGTQMKATGEVMAIAQCFEMALLKSIRSLEENLYSLYSSKLSNLKTEEIKEMLTKVNNDRIFVIAEALRRGVTKEEINEITKIDIWFIDKFLSIIEVENDLKTKRLDENLLRKAKKIGFPDKAIADFSEMPIETIKELRKKYKINPTFKIVDTCAAEFSAQTPYYYSSYATENEAIPTENKKKVIVLGSGPIRIGQGIEFDYCSVHNVWSLKKEGYETIIINNNPETVSTDFDIADKLYFEPLTKEDVENIIELEKPYGVVVQFGGQTAIKLTKDLLKMGVNILGTSAENVDKAEDREKFDEVLENCEIIRPQGATIFTIEEALKISNELGYPVLIRPSYVLGGQGMAIAFSDKDIEYYMEIINRTVQENPILIDKYIMGQELEVDAICDGEEILVPGIMEHIERAGVHSGDSISVYPSQKLSRKNEDIIMEYTYKIAKELNVIGMMNIQFIVHDDTVYIIEVNPRSSRTVPYISKVTGLDVIDIATKVILGKKLKDIECGTGLYKRSKYIAIKLPVFSFEKIKNADISLGPEMKSTGEVLGIADNFKDALYKAFIGTNIKIPKQGNIAVSVNDNDKEEVAPIIKEFSEIGFKIFSTFGTGSCLKEKGIDVTIINKLSEGGKNITNMLENKELDFVINTPTRGKIESRDGFKIRRSAIEAGVPCITSLDTANALLSCIKHNRTEDDIDVVDISKIEPNQKNGKKENKSEKKNLVNLKEISIEEINEILDLAEEFKNGKKVDYKGEKVVANLFFEPSTRTHYSFNSAALKLGCKTVEFAPESSSVQKGESLYDTVKTFEAIGVDAFVIRHKENEYYKQLTNIKVPILSGGDGSGNHPTQSLLDLLTIKQEFKKFKGLSCVIAGDITHSRVAHTNIEIMKRLGMKVMISGPKEFLEEGVEAVNLDDVIDKVDIVMLLRVQLERHDKKLEITNEEYNIKYGLNMEKVNKMKDSAIIMHPAPFNREVEITSDVVECEKSRIFKQMENGIFIRMAVLNRVLD